MVSAVWSLDQEEEKAGILGQLYIREIPYDTRVIAACRCPRLLLGNEESTKDQVGEEVRRVCARGGEIQAKETKQVLRVWTCVWTYSQRRKTKKNKNKNKRGKVLLSRAPTIPQKKLRN